MTAASHDLERRLDAWFAATTETDGPPPPERLAQVLAQTVARTPRPAALARIGSHWVRSAHGGTGRVVQFRPRPGLVVALMVLVTLALIGGAMLVGSFRPDLPWSRTTEAAGITVERAPDLPAPIANPVLASLPDGRVLVIDSGSSTALVYDPASGATASVGPMTGGARANGPAVRLADGRILILGDGITQRFDPTTQRFSQVGPRTTQGSWPSTATLPDGRIVIVSGRDVELFDPISGSFAAAGSLGMSRDVLAALPDGQVFAVGGDCCTSEVYDPATRTSTLAGSMPEGALAGEGCCGPSHAIPVPGGRIIVFGSVMRAQGGSVARWDQATEQFTDARRLSGPADATLLPDGRILLIGGGASPWAGIYDPATNEVIPTAPPTAWRPASTQLVDGRILVAGGRADGAIRPDPSGGVGLDAPAVATVEIFQ